VIEAIVGIGVAVLATVGVVSVASVAIIRNLLYICEPNEVLVFSGRSEGGRPYRIVKGGRAVRTPLIEKVDRMDLTNMIIDVTVQGAYSKGGIPLTVQGVANLKIAGHQPLLDHAVERLLNKSREEIMRIAKDVLEGNLRGVLSQLTPEQVNEDKLAFAEKLLEEAEQDLSRLGLVLDTMKIQNVSDDRGYLDSIGRKSSAEIIRSARIAEAKAKARAIIQDAKNRQRARTKEIEAAEAVSVAEAERRIIDAQTRAHALVAEQEGRVNAEIAKAEGAILAEEARVEQVRRRLEADVIEPARAEMEAGIAAAHGKAAKILEQGRATVTVLEEMITVWKQAGPDAREIFLMQKLQPVLGSLIKTVDDVKIERVTMLPGTTASATGGTGAKSARLVEELKASVGVDVPALLQQLTQR
jgi:flotillin